jgi:hypothetical protein
MQSIFSWHNASAHVTAVGLPLDSITPQQHKGYEQLKEQLNGGGLEDAAMMPGMEGKTSSATAPRQRTCLVASLMPALYSHFQPMSVSPHRKSVYRQRRKTLQGLAGVELRSMGAKGAGRRG